MERYETLFAQLKNRQEGAFVPFVTLGDPGPEQSLKIIDALIEGGADALELGIPFSDPLADEKMAAVVLAVTVAMSLSACSNMSKRDRNTAIGAGAGAIGGAVLTDGSALGTLGGAAVGGIIGHQVGK